MSNLVFAFSVYLGLGAFFGVIPTALICGASIITSVVRGTAALAIFVVLGFLASLATRGSDRDAQNAG